MDIQNKQLSRKVILLAGPSGSGKGRLSAATNIPALNLDDFYKDHNAADLPQAFGIVDWDDPKSWHFDQALHALIQICETGQAKVPIYSISQSLRQGSKNFTCGTSPVFIAEGIFAAELVMPLQSQGILADAIVLDRNPALVLGLRLIRDIKEARKPIHTLLRRGLGLAKIQPKLVEQWASKGMRRMNLRQAQAQIQYARQSGQAPGRNA